ncbi:hypothetical protein [Tunturiibacter gelidoferens]|uniref:Uncharacterized protein n=1 Tax=Tunturiibacter lichenicola TaxID=2051959 RepID=A0A7Y9NID9_9BACT|nr:hypothetical protein [Edaphobacter lichenicola]NYF49879.1 hypothetical protein [Edaphobacter lichenicola]
MRFATRVTVLICLLGAGLRAQSSSTAKQIVDTMLTHENDPAEHGNRYMYLSEERSERTGGHLWQERVVETSLGKVRLLLAEDGKPLSAERAAAERERLAQIVAHPEVFQRREQAMKSDEEHAEQMLALLRKAFLFEDPRVEGSDLQIVFRPDPAYKTQSLEERVLHAMWGTVVVDQRTMQLHRIEGKMPADVSLGYGLLGTVHAGSSFSTTHEMEPGGDWKDATVNTAIEGKALLFKEISRSEHLVHSEFRQMPADMSVAQAVEMLER